MGGHVNCKINKRKKERSECERRRAKRYGRIVTEVHGAICGGVCEVLLFESERQKIRKK